MLIERYIHSPVIWFFDILYITGNFGHFSLDIWLLTTSPRHKTDMTLGGSGEGPLYGPKFYKFHAVFFFGNVAHICDGETV